MTEKKTKKEAGAWGTAPVKMNPAKKAEGFGTKHVAPENPKFFPVTELAEKAGLKPWETAGLMRYVRWAEGKQVTEADFGTALEQFNYRPMGSGRAA